MTPTPTPLSDDVLSLMANGAPYCTHIDGENPQAVLARALLEAREALRAELADLSSRFTPTPTQEAYIRSMLNPAAVAVVPMGRRSGKSLAKRFARLRALLPEYAAKP